MNIINDTYFPLDGTTTITTIISSVQNELLEHPHNATDEVIIFNSFNTLTYPFLSIIEVYLQLKDSQDDLFTNEILSVIDQFVLDVEKTMDQNKSNPKTAAGILLISVSLTRRLERSSKRYNQKRLENAVGYLESKLLALHALIQSN